MKYFDGHAHIHTQYFEDSVEGAIKLAQEWGVDKMVLPSTDIPNSLKAIELAKKYDFLYAAIGLHPADTFDVEKCNFLDDINPDDVVAVGEIGIDLYRDTNPPLEVQKEVFEKQLLWAKKHDKPIIIHMREGEAPVYEIVKRNMPLKFVMHSYTGSKEWAHKFLELGGYISFSGIATFKNAPHLRELALEAPLNQILVETDTPFLAPVPMRGKPNTPAYVKYTADMIADLRPEPNEEVLKKIYENTVNLYLK